MQMFTTSDDVISLKDVSIDCDDVEYTMGGTELRWTRFTQSALCLIRRSRMIRGCSPDHCALYIS